MGVGLHPGHAFVYDPFRHADIVQQAAADGILFIHMPAVPVQPPGEAQAFFCHMQAVHSHRDIPVVGDFPRILKPLRCKHVRSQLLHIRQEFLFISLHFHCLQQFCEKAEHLLAEPQV